MPKALIVKPAAWIGALALSVALGVVVVGYGLLLPGLDPAGALVDHNLALALAAPLNLRLANVLLVACVVVALAIHRWQPSRVATALTLLLAGAALAHRLLAPRVSDAWSRVDAVARRPEDALARAESLADVQLLALAVIAGLVVVIIGMTARHREPAPRDT